MGGLTVPEDFPAQVSLFPYVAPHADREPGAQAGLSTSLHSEGRTDAFSVHQDHCRTGKQLPAWTGQSSTPGSDSTECPRRRACQSMRRRAFFGGFSLEKLDCLLFPFGQDTLIRHDIAWRITNCSWTVPSRILDSCRRITIQCFGTRLCCLDVSMHCYARWSRETLGLPCDSAKSTKVARLFAACSLLHVAAD